MMAQEETSKLYGAVIFKLSEADRLSRAGQSDQAWIRYEEARKWAESKGISTTQERFASIMPAVSLESLALDRSKEGLQVVIGEALLWAEEASEHASQGIANTHSAIAS